MDARRKNINDQFDDLLRELEAKREFFLSQVEHERSTQTDNLLELIHTRETCVNDVIELIQCVEHVLLQHQHLQTQEEHNQQHELHQQPEDNQNQHETQHHRNLIATRIPSQNEQDVMFIQVNIYPLRLRDI